MKLTLILLTASLLAVASTPNVAAIAEEQWAVVSISPISDANPLPGWANNQFDARRFMRRWCDTLVMRYPGTKWRGGHDEGVFTCTLPAFYLMSGYPQARTFTLGLADDFIRSPMAEACNCFLTEKDATGFKSTTGRKYHGYPADYSCIIHGPENYSWFLAPAAWIGGPNYTDALRDASEHIGNFTPDTPPWYDWKEHRFRSLLLGTKRVRDYPPYNFETLNHVKLMQAASNTYGLTGDKRYLDLLVDWCDKWADIIVSAGDNAWPIARYPVPDDKVKEIYGTYAYSDKSRANSDLIQLLLDVNRFSPHPKYVAAAKSMIDTALTYSDSMTGNLVAKYRALTGDKSFDERMLKVADADMARGDLPAAILVVRHPPEGSDFGDMNYVMIDGKDTARKDIRSVANIMAAWAITGDVKYAERGLQIAAGRVSSSWYLLDGREIGCQGKSNSRNAVSIADGLSALGFSSQGGYGMFEGEIPWFEVHYCQEDGRPGTPENLMTLYSNAGGKNIIRFSNSNDASTVLYIQSRKPGVALPKFDKTPGWTKLMIPAKSNGIIEAK
ncbi:MAG: hypothetical protein WCL39_01300 [Armatimonadota bacterium]